MSEIWVVKDGFKNFASQTGFIQEDKYTWAYVSFKTFSPECQGYTDVNRANMVLEELNIRKNILGMDLNFYLEKHSLESIDQLIEENSRHIGETMVIYRKNIPSRLSYAK